MADTEETDRAIFIAGLTSAIENIGAAKLAGWIAWNLPDDHEAIHQLLIALDAIAEIWQVTRVYFQATIIPSDLNILIAWLRAAVAQESEYTGEPHV